jgi:hypothetical protein
VQQPIVRAVLTCCVCGRTPVKWLKPRRVDLRCCAQFAESGSRRPSMVEILWPPPPATPSGTLELHDTTDTVTHEVNHAGHTNKAYVSILFCFVMLTVRPGLRQDGCGNCTFPLWNPQEKLC